MTMFKKCLVWVLLLFSVLGIVVGYSALTDNLILSGNAEVEGKPFVGIYISDA